MGGVEGREEVLVCGKLDWTEPGRNSREQGGGGAADRRPRGEEAPRERGGQGPCLFTCLCRSGWRPGQGWPSPKAGSSCFGLCWWRGRCSVGKEGQGCVTECQGSTGRVRAPAPATCQEG